MKRTILIGVVVGVIWLGARPVSAQTAHHKYVRVFSGVTVGDGGSSDFGAAAGFESASWLRISAEAGRMADVTPWTIKSRFKDPFLATVGVTVSPRISALYGLTDATVTLPVRPHLRPYVGGGIGVTRMTDHLDVTGSSEFGRMIRDDRSTGAIPAMTRPLTSLHAGVAVPIAHGVAVNLGYRYMQVFRQHAELVTNRVQFGLAVGF